MTTWLSADDISHCDLSRIISAHSSSCFPAGSLFPGHIPLYHQENQMLCLVLPFVIPEQSQAHGLVWVGREAEIPRLMFIMGTALSSDSALSSSISFSHSGNPGPGGILWGLFLDLLRRVSTVFWETQGQEFGCSPCPVRPAVRE